MKFIDRQGKIVEKEDILNEFLEKSHENLFINFGMELCSTRWFSILGAKFLESKYSKPLIRKFVKAHNIDMSVYQNQRYGSYNDFFTRKIKPQYRRFSSYEKDLCSPCDAKLQVFDIDEKLQFIVKNSVYTVESLLKDKSLADEFIGGKIAVFRLGVDNYHRFSYVDEGKKGNNIHIDGRYYSVLPAVIEKRPVYKENSREYCVIETKNFGKMIQMEVGATLVGRIVNYHEEKEVLRGEEKGYFEFGGSTIVLIFKENMVNFDKKYLNSEYEVEVFMGDKIGTSI